MKSGIYKITNIISGKFYIGSSQDIRSRKNAHYTCLRKNKHHSPHLQYSFNKYGEENFKFEIIAKCPPEYCVKLEQWFLDKLTPEYNVYKTAYSPLGSKHSEESKLKMSKSKKGVPKPEGFGDRLKIIKKGQFVSEECKAKLKLAYSKRKIKGNPSVLNEEKVLEIRKLIKEGNSFTKIGKMFGVTQQMISRINTGKSWSNIKLESNGL